MASSVANGNRGRTSARKAAAVFLKRIMSSDDLSRKANKAPVFARARSLHNDQSKDATRGADTSTNTKSDRKQRALSSPPRNAQSVIELLECPICFERFNQPKMLPCQHTFCLGCLEDQQLKAMAKDASEASTEKDSLPYYIILCPTCRYQVKIDREKGIAGLPRNFYIESLLRVVKANGGTIGIQRQHSTIQPPTYSVEINCSQCDTSCTGTKCEHCQQILCGVCWPTHMSDLREQLLVAHQQLENAQKRLQAHGDEFREKCVDFQEQITMTIETKIKLLRETEKELTNVARKIQSDYESSTHELRQRLAGLAAAAPSEEQRFELEDDAGKVALYLKTHRTAAQLLKAVGRLGEPRFTLNKETLKIEYKVLQPNDEALALKVLDVVDGKTTDKEKFSADSVSLYYRSRSLQVPRLRLGRGSILRPAGLGIAPWASGIELYVAASDGHVIVVYDKRNGRQLRQLASSEHHMLCPVGVAFCGTRSEIYVSDKWRHCIHVFARDGKYLRQLGAKGRVEGSFLSPEGIACDSEAGLLYVCDTCNDRVQVIRIEDGSFVRQLGTSNSAEFNQPTGVALSKDRVVVCDHGNRRIKIYSQSTNQKISEFGSSGSARGQFRTPECVAVDKTGFILVGDSGNGRVQVFRPNGQVVMAFGRFSWVSGIHVTQNFELYVSDSKGHCVSIYY